MRTTRWLLWTAMLMTGWLLGCGSSGWSASRPLVDRLPGRWSLSMVSHDGGQSFAAPSTPFELALAADGTWTDSVGARGSWTARDQELILTHAARPPRERYLCRLSVRDSWLTVTETNAAGWPTGEQLVYQRIVTAPTHTVYYGVPGHWYVYYTDLTPSVDPPSDDTTSEPPPVPADEFGFDLADDGTWTDTEGNWGTWEIDSGNLYVVDDTDEGEWSFRWSLRGSGGGELVLTDAGSGRQATYRRGPARATSRARSGQRRPWVPGASPSPARARPAR